MVEDEIGLDRGVVEVGAALPQDLGVVAPVPRGERKITALLRDQRLQGVAVGERPGAGGLPDPLQEAAYGFRVLAAISTTIKIAAKTTILFRPN